MNLENNPQNDFFPPEGAVVYTISAMSDEPICVFRGDDNNSYYIEVYKNGNEWIAKNQYSRTVSNKNTVQTVRIFLNDYDPKNPIKEGDGVKITSVDNSIRNLRIGKGVIFRKEQV